MKRILCLLIVTSFFSAAGLLAQEISYDIKVRYNSNVSPVNADITVTVSRGTPSFTFYLMTNDPVTGDVLQESAPMDKGVYTFTRIEPGKYFVKIVDKNGMTAGKTIDIKAEGN
jgi:hypothetical protein